MKKIMGSLGECEAVESGIAAVTAFKDALEKGVPFDLITLDIFMPGMDGTEVLYEIRGIERTMQIPKEKRVKIIMVTGQADKDTIVTCIQAGCDNYIAKPFDINIIVNKLKVMGFVDP